MSKLTDINLEKFAYSTKEVAAIFGISRAFQYKLMRQGILETAKIGARRLVLRDSLCKLISGAAK